MDEALIIMRMVLQRVLSSGSRPQTLRRGPPAGRESSSEVLREIIDLTETYLFTAHHCFVCSSIWE